ncbi:alpha/beta hydrolase [Desulfonatronum sp. SC1]|uniref:alpha/beta hydrolase n=1 Tax=Desulfonatronum sp. SC1 TaxID=2109626 RepID=UPI000D3265FB|nr:alpha/beta hydrolase [Desulfonatronum sp. SC1]PTN36985.1 alpha/beta hydrolase [Desulfonatronum sp. SC1]
MHSTMTIAVILVLLYLGLAGWVYVRQDAMVFHPVAEISLTPADVGWEYDDLTLSTSDGVNINAWFVPVEDARGVVLFCHGNAGNIGHRLDSIRIFRDLGLSVLIFDYRGFGRSEGRPSEFGTYLDAQTAWAFLVEEKGVEPGRIIIFGRSLGGAVAAHLAAHVGREKAPGALILESTFTSLPDMAARLYPFLPVRWLAKYSYNTLGRISDVHAPVLVVHSPGDEIIPYANGQALYAAAPEPKMFLEISGGHNSGFLSSGAVYVEGLDVFFEQHVFAKNR